MKFLFLALVVLFCAPIVTLRSHPHPPIAAQITTGIDHQQPTGDPDPLQPEKYPGQREHAIPPEGFYCEHQNFTLTVDDAHQCKCERMFDPDDPTVIREDRDCTVWCHADRCKCPIGGNAKDGQPILQP